MSLGVGSGFFVGHRGFAKNDLGQYFAAIADLIT
jgi:hypothetical protein